jgi:zinc protease
MKHILLSPFFFLVFNLNAQKAIDPLNVKQYVLDNGLTVLLTENHNEAKVFGVVAVKAGGKNDPKDATGMAHYLEHMLFKGTEEMGTWDYENEVVHLNEIKKLYEDLGNTLDSKERESIQLKINEASIKAGQYAIPNEMDRMLSEIGSSNVNAFTTEDYTAYINEFPSNKLEHWLKIYAHRFEKPVFRLFQSELETVYEEKNISMDSPFSVVFDEFNKNFWKKHPYGQQTIIGHTEHLKNPSLKKMYEYFETYYVANNMVLALSGDFNADETIELIRKYFSDWRKGEIPVFPEYKEDDFKGKESITIKATPIKAALRGYRTPPNGHLDQQKIQLLSYLLSNNEGSGFLDNLTNEGKVSYSGIFPMEYNDYSAVILFVVPKIVGQSFEAADLLIDEQLEKVKSGSFDDKFFDGAKISLQKSFERELETNFSRTMLLVEAFTANIPWEKYIADRNQISTFTKEEIVEVAKKYFGENYFTLYSKMGSVKKDKLTKPKFEPVIPIDGKESIFTKEWRQTPTLAIKPSFVNIENDVHKLKMANNVVLRTVQNPFNEIFDLKITWGIGSQHDSLLFYLPSYLNKVGTHNKTVTEVKNSLFEFGASMNFSSNDHEFSLSIEGVERNFEPTLALVNNFLVDIKHEQSVLASVANEIATERKFENKDLNTLLDASVQFALYGGKSSFLREMGSSEVKKIKSEDLKKSFENARKYAIKIDYVGNKTIKHVSTSLKEHLKVDAVPNEALEKKIYKKEGFESPKVYFLNDKKALQSQIMILAEGKPFSTEKIGNINAFNLYFSDDMSSLVFQEIREFRSLAYATYANYSKEKNRGDISLFRAYVGCQGDKTLESIGVMMNLIKNMPEKREREDAIRSALVSEAKSSKPPFRDLIKTVDAWEKLGFKEDPNKNLISFYNDLSFNQIVDFYNEFIKNQPLQLVIVGNKKKFDLKELSKYGKIIELNPKKVVKT